VITYPGGGDLYQPNDTVYSHFKLRFGDEFAYLTNKSNDVGGAVGVSG
jgi:hypothetical protein